MDLILHISSGPIYILVFFTQDYTIKYKMYACLPQQVWKKCAFACSKLVLISGRLIPLFLQFQEEAIFFRLDDMARAFLLHRNPCHALPRDARRSEAFFSTVFYCHTSASWWLLARLVKAFFPLREALYTSSAFSGVPCLSPSPFRGFSPLPVS